MQILEPKVILLGTTKMVAEGFSELMAEIGASKFQKPETSDGEALIEIGGRLCYKSFAVGLNRNVTRVRADSLEYHENILKQKHGSVLEHCYTTFVLLNVSRIFTHEIVRHRAGAGFSQESMRFVRLDNIGMYYPKAFKTEDSVLNAKIQLIFENVVRTSEIAIDEIGKLLKIDEQGTPFAVKKKITSALRRLAPSGHTTNIMMTCNQRAWRHILALRTSPAAEEELWPVMHKIGSQLKALHPLVYQDMFLAQDEEKKNGYLRDGWHFAYDKV